MDTTRPGRRGPSAIQIAVFLAGFTFLIYEVSWYRQLALTLGATVTAATLVLAAFMAGLGAGAFAWARTAAARRDPLRLLALLVAGIGVLGALGHAAFTGGVPLLYAWLGAQGASSGVTNLAAKGATLFILLAQTFLMGGVFPLASALAVRGEGTIGRSLGRLYALETLGSTLGGLAAGFLLLGALGQRATVGLAVGIDLLLAAWLLAGLGFPRGAIAPDESPADLSRTSRPSRRRASFGGRSLSPAAQRTLGLLGAFTCGFALLALQVVWLRIMRVYLTNTSYTFALIASFVILGAFIGSEIFARRDARIAGAPRALLFSLAGLTLSAGIGLLLLIRMPQTLMFPFESALADPLLRVLGIPSLASLLIVLPPAVLSGFIFPLACRMAVADRATAGRDVGQVLMANTAGAVLGPVITTFGLLPLLGAARSGLFVLILMAGATLFVATQQTRKPANRRRRAAAGAVLVLPLAGLLLMPTIRILPPSFLRFDRDILFYRESVEGTLSVGQDRGGPAPTKHTFVDNSAVIGSSYDAIKVVKMVGYLPHLMGLDCREVLVIGFGIGVTTSAIASIPGVESIECVELVEGLIDASVHYRDLNNSVTDDPRLRVIPGDGRHYLQRTSRTYDLISCDPTHPILGSGNLYTRDYFALCRQNLKPGGMVSQYLPLHKLGPEEFMGLISTFREVFPHSTVWLGHFHAVLLGGLVPLRVDFPSWSDRVAGLAHDRQFHIDPYQLASTLTLTGNGIASRHPEGWINTDDRSYTEFFHPRCLDPRNIATNLRLLMDVRDDWKPVFTGVPDYPLMERYIQGNQLLTESFYHKMTGDPARGLGALRLACQANPENRELPLLLRLHY